MAFSIPDEAVAIPPDYSFFAVCALLCIIVACALKIAWRWYYSYKVEYELHSLLQDQGLVEKKKRAF